MARKESVATVTHCDFPVCPAPWSRLLTDWRHFHHWSGSLLALDVIGSLRSTPHNPLFPERLLITLWSFSSFGKFSEDLPSLSSRLNDLSVPNEKRIRRVTLSAQGNWSAVVVYSSHNLARCECSFSILQVN